MRRAKALVGAAARLIVCVGFCGAVWWVYADSLGRLWAPGVHAGVRGLA